MLLILSMCIPVLDNLHYIYDTSVHSNIPLYVYSVISLIDSALILPRSCMKYFFIVETF